MESSRSKLSSYQDHHSRIINAVHGNIYQSKLLMLFLYRGVSRKYSFRLGTEIEEAEKFDDLVFEYIQGGKKIYRLLQAKHKLDESVKIKAKHLFRNPFKTNSKLDYSLIKYFHSYQSSKKSDLFKQGSIKDVIICTNIDFDFESLKRAGICVDEIKDDDDILDLECDSKQPIRYRFREDVAKLREITEYCDGEGDIKDFLDHLVFAVNQPNEEELGKIIKEEMGKEFDFDFNTAENVYNKFFVKSLNWLQGKERDRFLTYEEGKEFFSEAKRGIPIQFRVRQPVMSFIGRAKQLDNLHNLLQGEGETVKSHAVSISGLGGVGKSELARKYINERGQDYDNNVIWINAENYHSLAESFLILASDKLCINTKNVDGEEKEMISIVEDVHKFFSNRKSLFVFDNAEKYKSQNEFDHGLDKFLFSTLPNNETRSYTLIISRNQKWPTRIRVLSLDAFTEEESIEFIKNSLGIENNEQVKEIEELSKELQRFPLALQQAVSYIRVQDKKMRNVGSEFKVSSYLRVFKEKTEELLNFEFPEDSDNGYTKTTYVTWNVTLDAIRQKEYGGEALNILNIVSYFAPENISINFFLRLLKDEDKLGSTIELLTQYSMVYVEELKLELAIHSLVQQVIRLKLEKRNKEEETLRNILTLFGMGIDAKTVDHAISAWGYCSKYSKIIKEFAQLAACICDKLSDSARYDEAYLFGLKVSDLLIELQDDQSDHDAHLRLKNSIAGVLSKKGKYGMGLEILQEILSIQISIGKQNDPSTLCVKNNIGTALLNQGKFNEALEYFREILEIKKIILGEKNPDTLFTQFNIAQVFVSQKKYGEALPMLQEIDEIQKNILDKYPDKYPEYLDKLHLQNLAVRSNISIVLCQYSKYDETFQILQEIYSSQETNLGKKHPDTLNTKKNIAKLLEYQNMLSKALKIFQEVLDIQKKVLGDNHPDVLDTNKQIAGVLLAQNNYSEALEVFKNVFDKQSIVLGSDHPYVLDTKFKIANSLHKLGKYSDALQIYQEVKNKRKVILGNDHADTLAAATCIAGILSVQGECNKSLQQFQEINEIQKRCLGENHLEALNTKISIGMSLRQIGEYDEALQVVREVYDSFQNFYPNNSRFIFYAKSQISLIFSCQEKYDEALKILREVLEFQEVTFGKEHHDTLQTKNNIADIFYHQEKYDDALSVYQEVFKGLNKVLGPEHPHTLEVRNMIQLLLRYASNLEKVKKLIENGSDINQLLWQAVQSNDVDIVKFLFKRGAKVLKIYFEDKTLLHIATSHGQKEIVNILLRQVKFASEKYLIEFIDAKATLDGNTSLHFAAEKGSLQIVLSLLKQGATYDIKNKNGKIPLSLSKKQNITNFLKLVSELFEDAKKGNGDIINKLKELKPDKFRAASSARNNEGLTLLRVAVVNEHKTIASKLVEILRQYHSIEK